MLAKNKGIQREFGKFERGGDFAKKANNLSAFLNDVRLENSKLRDLLDDVDGFLTEVVFALENKIDGVGLDGKVEHLGSWSRDVLLEPAFEAHFKRRDFQQLVSGFIQEAFNYSTTYTPHSMFHLIPEELERCLDRQLAREAVPAKAKAAPAPEEV